MLVNEIFTSIEGEGIRQGFVCTFVRLYGCPLRCSYCDTRYACEGGCFSRMSVGDIIARVKQAGAGMVTLTGGEPLAAGGICDLVSGLLAEGLHVNIETSGHVDFTALFSDEYRARHRDSLLFTVDWKSPSSGMQKMMNEECFRHLQKQDVLKFVVSDEDDLDDMRRMIGTFRPECHLFVGAVFGRIEPRIIAEYLIRHRIGQVRLQLQMHKYVWDPAARGV